MEPVGTLTEGARLLRPGGVFAAIDNDWPPTVDWEAEALDRVFAQNAAKLTAAGNYNRGLKQWRKDEHMERISASGHFRYTKEIAVHNVEQGNADRLVGLALSQGTIQTLLKSGITEEQLGVPAFRAEAKRILGDAPQPWYFIYRIRIGVK